MNVNNKRRPDIYEKCLGFNLRLNREMYTIGHTIYRLVEDPWSFLQSIQRSFI